MLRNVRDSSYLPTLAIRPSEMRALEELAESDKNILFPCVLLCPWVASGALEKAIDRVQAAYGERPFFLDRDHSYRVTNEERPAQREFLDLQEPVDGFSNWFEFVNSCPQAIPVLQLPCPDAANLRQQIMRAEQMARGFGVRINRVLPEVRDFVFKVLSEIEHNDLVFFLDAGWSRDPLQHEDWFLSTVRRLLEANPAIPIVLSCSSFPLEFSSFEGVEHIVIHARRIFDNVRRAFNEAILIYGDWASTKPRRYQDGGSHPLPRIDYARRTDWIIARNKDEEWGFVEAARALISSHYWDPDLSVWGTYMIQRTAQKDEFSINTIQKAVAARVNIHLHLQARFAQGGEPIDTDDPWVD